MSPDLIDLIMSAKLCPCVKGCTYTNNCLVRPECTAKDGMGSSRLGKTRELEKRTTCLQKVKVLEL